MSSSQHIATTRYFDRNFSRQAVKLLPGEYFVSTQEMLVTVLGSCVSACIYDKELGLGGMNHFMLPESKQVESARFGLFAMEILINDLLKRGARRNKLCAKVFGGGAVLDSLESSKIGEKNANFVRKFLLTENIRIEKEDLLGLYPRKIYFFPDTTKVLLKYLKRTNNETITQRELSYQKDIQNSSSGSIDLF